MSNSSRDIKYPVDALVVVQGFEDSNFGVAIVVETENGPVNHVGLATDKVDAYILAIKFLTDKFPDYPVNLYCADEQLGAAMRSLGSWPSIEVMDHKLIRSHGSERDVKALLVETSKELETITVACDGSHSWSQNTGGWGFVSEEGQYGQGSGKSTSSAYAELKAVELALKSLDGNGREFLFRVDSKEAISLLQLGPKETTPVQIRRLVAKISIMPNFHRTQFEWVRGHGGDPLNEAANRLAIAARRNTDSGTSSSVASMVAKSILRDHLSEAV